MNLFQLPRKNFKMHEQGSKAHPLEWVPLTTAFEITYDVSNIKVKNEQRILSTFGNLSYLFYELFDIYSFGLHIWAYDGKMLIVQKRASWVWNWFSSRHVYIVIKKINLSLQSIFHVDFARVI